MAAATTTPVRAPTSRATSTGQAQRRTPRFFGGEPAVRDDRVGRGSYSMSAIIGGMGGSGLSASSGDDRKTLQGSETTRAPEDRMEPQSPPPPVSPFQPAPGPVVPQ